MQRRPTGLVDIRAPVDQFFHQVDLATQRHQHQRTFITRVAGFDLGLGPANQHVDHPGRRLLHCQQQGMLTLGIQSVGVEAPVQEAGNRIWIVPLDGGKKVFVRTRLCQRKPSYSSKIRKVLKVFYHGTTPLKSRSKLRLVASATASSAMPRTSAIWRATCGT